MADARPPGRKRAEEIPHPSPLERAPSRVAGPHHGGFGGTCGGGWCGLSVPVILGVNFENGEEWHRELARQTLRLQLTGAYGVDPVSGITGGHLGLTFGYAKM